MKNRTRVSRVIPINIMSCNFTQPINDKKHCYNVFKASEHSHAYAPL